MASRKRTESVLTRRIDDSGTSRRPEAVLVEEPLEIRLDGEMVATTMRTPGNDFELAVGWCWSEGLLAGASVSGIRYCATGSAVDTAFNVVTVETTGRTTTPRARLGTVTSSCGICGVEVIDELVERLAPLPPSATFDARALWTLSDRIAPQQELFALTGGSHAAAACTADGRVIAVREDIGRHNAVDKVVGSLVLDESLPATGQLLWVSGRASFELVQKAWAAGFAGLLSVSAPSSLAVTMARRAGLVLMGFGRDGRLTVFSGDGAVSAGPGAASQLRNETDPPGNQARVLPVQHRS